MCAFVAKFKRDGNLAVPDAMTLFKRADLFHIKLWLILFDKTIIITENVNYRSYGFTNFTHCVVVELLLIFGSCYVLHPIFP